MNGQFLSLTLVPEEVRIHDVDIRQMEESGGKPFRRVILRRRPYDRCDALQKKSVYIRSC